MADATYDDDLNDLDRFAWDRGQSLDATVDETDQLSGFCLLIRREVIDGIGLLDDGFGVGTFEDVDYCRRAARAGFRAVVARDAFVHHVGAQTFRSLGVDYGGLLQANHARFLRKHSPTPPPDLLPPRVPQPVPALRVLLLAHVGVFRDRMDKSHYYRYEALAGRPGVTLFGPGIDGYLPGMAVEEAVRIACGGQWPDAIVHGCDHKASCAPLVSGLDRVPVVTALELADSWSFQDRQAAFIRGLKFTLGLIQEAAHHLRYYQEGCPQTEFVWTPNAVNTALFRDHGLAKEYDVILYGALNPEVYPLRARIAGLLARQRTLRVRHIPHPGYYPAASAATPVVAGEALSREINRAWIGIATSSIYRCFLMKYLETAASHALVAGDLPDQARSVFGNNYVELRLGDSDEAVIDKLTTALADKGRLQSMVDAMAVRVSREFSTEAFADRVLTALATAVSRRKEPA